MAIQISDKDFKFIKDHAYRAVILAFAGARLLDVNNESALKKHGPKCGWIHFAIVKNFINRGPDIGRDFWKDISSSDDAVFGSVEVRNFIHTYAKTAEEPDGRFIVALHKMVVRLLTIASLSGPAKDWMQTGHERFHGGHERQGRA